MHHFRYAASAFAAAAPTYPQSHRFSLALAIFVSSLWPALATAQTTAPPDDEEIVVTAPLEGSRIDSLQGANILRREDIVATLTGGLGDTLDSQPGIASTFFGAGASRPIIRGLGEDRVRVLQNGIGAIDASTASPDHAVTADGLDAERIEVLRGAAALAYGGNAIGGVINVIDQSIPTRASDGLSINGLAGHSSVDQGTQAELSAVAGGRQVAFRFAGGLRDTNNYDTPIGEAENSWTELRTYAFGASTLGEWGYGGVAMKHTQDNYGLLPETPGDPGGHIELEQTRYEARGDIRVAWGPFSRIDFGGQHAAYQHTEFEGDGAPGTRFTSNGWEGRVEAHHRGERLQGAVGLQYTDVDFAAAGDEAFITPTSTRDSGVFIVERWDNGGWGLEGGARLERRHINNMGGGVREFDNTSVSGGVFFRPMEHWFVGGTVARTERAPTQIELFADGPHLATESFELGDPALGQESAFSTELSARYNAGPASFEINIFHMTFADYIALVERGDVWWHDEVTDTSGFAPDEFDPGIPAGSDVLPVFIFTQQDATFAGGEIVGRLRLFDVGSFTVSGDAALDLVQADFDAGGHPPRIPPRALAVGITAESDAWTGRVEVVDTGDQTRLAQFETPTDGFTFVNVGLAFRPFGRAGDVTVRLDGRNLTDELGRAHASFLKDDLPLPGRNVRLTITTAF